VLSIVLKTIEVAASAAAVSPAKSDPIVRNVVLFL
jgi:energy-converting hydrogenase Eha subunit E